MRRLDYRCRTVNSLLSWLTEGRFPMLTAAVGAGVFEPPQADPETDLEDDFQFGLNLILDGVAALIRSKA